MSDGRTSVVAGGGVVGDGAYGVTCNEMIGNDILAALTPVLPGGTPLFMRVTVPRDSSLPPELPIMATLVEYGFARTPTSEDGCGAAAVPTKTSEGLFVFTGGPPNNVAR